MGEFYQVSICADKDIRIYNLEEKSERVIEEEKPITSLSVSKDGRYLLVNLVSQEIHLWDIAASSKLLFKYRGHRQGRYVIRSCFGGSDHAFIVSGSEDSQVCCNLLHVFGGYTAIKLSSASAFVFYWRFSSRRFSYHYLNVQCSFSHSKWQSMAQ
jgi:WD40 repeat protein